MIPENGLSQHLQRINGGIEPQDVTHFMTQDIPAVCGIVDLEIVSRQVDISPKRTPDKRLANTVKQPNLRMPLHSKTPE
jgi:hypothetical protein